MVTVASLQVKIDADKARQGAREFDGATDRVKRSAKDAEAQLQRLQRATDRSLGGGRRGGGGRGVGAGDFGGRGFIGSRGGFGASLGVGAGVFAAFAGVSVVTKATRGLREFSDEAINVAASAEEIESKFRAVFKEEVPRTIATLDELGDRVGRSTTRLQEYASSFQDTLVPMGVARDEAARMSEQLTELAIDVASFNNAQDPEAVQRFQSAIVGNSEAVLRYGINLKESEVKAEALRSGIIETDRQLTEQEKLLARVNLLFRGTADAQGDAERTSGSWTNQMKRLNDEVFDLRREMGDQLIVALQQAIEDFGGMDAVVASIALGFQSATKVAEAFIDSAGDAGRVAREFGLTADNLVLLTKTAKEFDLKGALLDALGSNPLGVLAEFDAATQAGVDAFIDDFHDRVVGGAMGAGEAAGEAARAGLSSGLSGGGPIGIDPIEVFGDESGSFRGAITDELERRRGVLESLRPTEERLAEIRALSEDLLRRESAAIDSASEARRKRLSDILKEVELSDQHRKILGDHIQTLREQELATLAVSRAFEEMRQAQAEAALFAEENPIAIGFAEDAMTSLSGALGNVATDFESLGEAAENVLRSVIRNLVAATAEAFLFQRVVAPIFQSGFGLSADQVGQIFGRTVENAKGNVFEGGDTVEAFASGGVISGGKAVQPFARGGFVEAVAAFADGGVIERGAVVRAFADGGVLEAGSSGDIGEARRVTAFAAGGVISAGVPVQPFAAGGFPVGMISGPTMFSMRGGMGLAGEAGPEVGFQKDSAIAPLKRGPGGRLGVEIVGGAGGGVQMTVSPTIVIHGKADARAVRGAVDQGMKTSTRQLERVARERLR